MSQLFTPVSSGRYTLPNPHVMAHMLELSGIYFGIEL